MIDRAIRQRPCCSPPITPVHPPPVHISASSPRRVVKGLANGEACSTVTVQLHNGADPQQAVACPDSTGTAAFAVPLTVGAGASTHPARLLVSAPGQQWQQMINIHGAVAVQIDMREAHVVVPAPAEGAAPISQSTDAAPITSCPVCPQRSCLELEEAGDRSLPTLLLLAALPASTCPLPSPTYKPSPLLPAASPELPAPALAPGTPPLLLGGLGLACAVQAVALALLLLRRGRGELRAAAAADGHASLSEAEAATSPRRPALRLSLRDACTSPLVFLASPFVGAKQRAAALGAIDEVADRGVAAAEPAAAEPQQQYGWQKLAPSAQHNAGYASLATPPNGWTRLVNTEDT